MIEIKDDRDTEAFVNLYESIYKDMYTQAIGVLGSEELAEQAVSNAVMDAYTTFDRLESTKDFGRWMHSILSNKCEEMLNNCEDSEIVEFQDTLNPSYIEARKVILRNDLHRVRQEYESNKQNGVRAMLKEVLGKYLPKILKYTAIGLGVAIVFTLVTFAYAMTRM